MKGILQHFANSIIKNLEEAIASNDTKAFDYYMNVGINLDFIAFTIFDVELD